jgi:hypothetical protein
MNDMAAPAEILSILVNANTEKATASLRKTQALLGKWGPELAPLTKPTDPDSKVRTTK